MALWRVRTAQGEPLARGVLEAGPTELLPAGTTLDGLLAAGAEALSAAAADGPTDGPVPASSTLLPPVGSQEVWAAGVTYATSRAARNEESGGHDFYDLVY